GMFNAKDAAGQIDPQKAAIASRIADIAKPEGASFDLQTVVSHEDGFSDPVTVIRELQLATRRVCEILIDRGETSRGSGFLVGPDVVLTNWHVVRALCPEGAVKPLNGFADRIKVRFDRAMEEAESTLGAAPREPVTLRVSAIEIWDTAYPEEY